MDRQDATKGERFEEFLRRLGASPASSDFDEAYRLVCDTLNSVDPVRPSEMED